MSTFAENLNDIVLDNGWKITSKVPKHSDDTGGYFSSQYIATNELGEKCFLKAIDIEKAILKSGEIGWEFTIILQQQMDNYNYERELLEYCKANSTSKIVLVKDYGIINLYANFKYHRFRRHGGFPMKKLLSLLLVMVMVLSLVACGKEQPKAKPFITTSTLSKLLYVNKFVTTPLLTKILLVPSLIILVRPGCMMSAIMPK